MPPDFATTGGTLIFDLLAGAMCDAAATHEAVCIDERPLIEFSEDSPESMQAVADALAATGLADSTSPEGRLSLARLRNRRLATKARHAMTHITVTNSQAPG